jgi:hypothetical protein
LLPYARFNQQIVAVAPYSVPGSRIDRRFTSSSRHFFTVSNFDGALLPAPQPHSKKRPHSKKVAAQQN